MANTSIFCEPSDQWEASCYPSRNGPTLSMHVANGNSFITVYMDLAVAMALCERLSLAVGRGKEIIAMQDGAGADHD